jgi:hypothetical protein
MMPMGDMFPAGMPPVWNVYFAVEDTDAIAAKTAESGGTVRQPPMDMPVGRMAVLADPHGAVFSVISLIQQ